MLTLHAWRNRGGMALARCVDDFDGGVLEIRLVHATAKFQFKIARIDQSVNHERWVIQVRRDQQGAALVVERALGDQHISTIVALYAYFGGSFGNPLVDERDHRVLVASSGGQRC